MNLKTDQIRFAQHNIAKQKRNVEGMILAWGDCLPDIVFIQEPAYYQIGLQPSLTEKDGVPVYGTPQYPEYFTFIPPGVDIENPR